MNKGVSFPIAKLLTEKGIIFETEEYYSSETKVSSVSYNEFPAPTIAEVLMWLYEKHGIWIACNLDLSNSQLFDYRLQKENYLKLSEIYYNSPTEAYEAAIEHTLNNLI